MISCWSSTNTIAWGSTTSPRSGRCGRFTKRQRTVLALLLGLACSLALSGCIPIPISSGPRKDSRTNIPEVAPPWIVVGQTTRRDVLLGLGDPDGKAPDERWFTYGSAIGLGGVGALFAFDSPGYTGRESVEYRRLIVRFDGNGVVSSVEWQKKRCAEYPLGGLVDSGTVTTVPCVDIQGNDLTSAAPDTLTGEIIAQYDNVRWRLSAAGGRPCKDQHQVALGASGLMKITRDSLILVLPATGQSERRAVVQHPAVAVTIPVSEMTSVMPPSRALRSARLVRPVNVDVEELMIVEQKNGSCLYVDLLYVEGHGQNKTKAASELLQKTIAVATAENGIPPSDPK